jgi:hypothetical protein
MNINASFALTLSALNAQTIATNDIPTANPASSADPALRLRG